MNRLDVIFYKRLERIRKELDAYINLRRSGEEQIFSAPTASGEIEEKKNGGILEKFLSYMKLNDDVYDDSDDMDEEESAYSDVPMPQAPRQASMVKPSVPADRIAGDVKILDFLRESEKRWDIDKVLAKKEESFSEMLLRLIDEKGLKDSEVYKRANIDRRLFSKIRGDVDYVPSKKTAISFCLALQLEMNEAKRLLEAAGYTLSASSRFDLIIMYLIENSEYNIHFANIVLDDYGEGTLSR